MTNVRKTRITTEGLKNTSIYLNCLVGGYNDRWVIQTKSNGLDAEIRGILEQEEHQGTRMGRMHQVLDVSAEKHGMYDLTLEFWKAEEKSSPASTREYTFHFIPS